jgi:hypothetical protein
MLTKKILCVMLNVPLRALRGWVLLFSFIDILRAPTPFSPETPPL